MNQFVKDFTYNKALMKAVTKYEEEVEMPNRISYSASATFNRSKAIRRGARLMRSMVQNKIENDDENP